MEQKIIDITSCSGKTPESTLKNQLLKHGIINRDDNGNEPGTIFNWMMHHAHEHYEPVGLRHGIDWHCGICFHHITNVYKYVSRTGERPLLEIPGGVILRMPVELISGSECIGLTGFMQRVISRMIKTFKVPADQTIQFKYGLISADWLIRGYTWWPPELYKVVLPTECFYFTPDLRQKLMLGQLTRGYGYHVKLSGSGDRINWKKAINATPNISAFKLFLGFDESGTWCTVNTERQTADHGKFVVITSETAKRLCEEGF